MFKIAVNPTFSTSVRVELPGDNGKPIIKVYTAKFKRASQTELDQIVERLRNEELTDSSLLDEVMVGWDGVQDEDGNELAFNATNLAALLDVHPVRPTTVKAFFAAINGAKAKN